MHYTCDVVALNAIPIRLCCCQLAACTYREADCCACLSLPQQATSALCILGCLTPPSCVLLPLLEGPYSAGDILRWDGKAWVHQRKGTADEDIQLLRAVPPAGKTPAMVWAKLTTIKNGQAPSEALLLCDTAKCTSKVGRAGVQWK